MYVPQEAETFAVHPLLTIQDTEAIKWNLRNVQKWRGFAQRVTIIVDCSVRVFQWDGEKGSSSALKCILVYSLVVKGKKLPYPEINGTMLNHRYSNLTGIGNRSCACDNLYWNCTVSGKVPWSYPCYALPNFLYVVFCFVQAPVGAFVKTFITTV